MDRRKKDMLDLLRHALSRSPEKAHYAALVEELECSDSDTLISPYHAGGTVTSGQALAFAKERLLLYEEAESYVEQLTYNADT